MLSFAHLDRYYQLFLAQGIGLGLGSGLIYMPSMAKPTIGSNVEHLSWVLSSHVFLQCISDPPVPQFSFETGTSFGGIVFPIMLNQLFHGSVGFAWGVRAQAFVVFGLLAAANCLMSRPAQWNARPEIPKAKFLAMLKDVPFLLVIWG